MTSIRFIGSGDAFGSGGRLQTCILVDEGGWRCLLDCGATTLVGLARAGIDPASLDAVVVSHLHGDHFGGLPFLLLDAQFHHRRRDPLVLAGGPELEDRLRSAMEVLFPGSTHALDIVPHALITLAPGEVVALLPEGPAAPAQGPGPATVEAFEVNHACGAPPFAVRLTTPGGAVVAYSGDTEWTDDLLRAANGADVFVVETYRFDRPVRWHLDHATVAANLHRITARRTIGTHPGPDVLAHLDELAIELATDGMLVEL